MKKISIRHVLLLLATEGRLRIRTVYRGGKLERIRPSGEVIGNHGSGFRVILFCETGSGGGSVLLQQGLHQGGAAGHCIYEEGQQGQGGREG